jgi:hypothetical protein
MRIIWIPAGVYPVRRYGAGMIIKKYGKKADTGLKLTGVGGNLKPEYLNVYHSL